MLGRAQSSYDRAAAEAGLGERRKVHRVTRYAGNMLVRWGLAVPSGILLVILGLHLWSIVLVVALAACAVVVYKLTPPEAGPRAIVRYGGGLVVVEAGGRCRALPWSKIESCRFERGFERHRAVNQTEIRFDRFHLSVLGERWAFEVVHLRGSAELARQVNLALVPVHVERFREQLAAEGSVALGPGLTVTADGVRFGVTSFFHDAPLPWSAITDVGPRDRTSINVWADVEIIPGSTFVKSQATDPVPAAGFIRLMWQSAVGTQASAQEEHGQP